MIVLSGRELNLRGVSILRGSSLEWSRRIPARVIQVAVTSPPYYGLRDYKAAGQIGIEDTPEKYVSNLLAVFSETWRILRDDGVLYVNIGDSYNANGRTGHGSRIGCKQGTNRASAAGEDSGRANAPELKEKELIGIPWRLAFAMQRAGWYLRQELIWAKPNPMPGSVSDRCTTAHEHVFMFSKSRRYFYDAVAIAEPAAAADSGGPEFRNKRSVWTVPVQPYEKAHFATFPPKLIEPCILAGSSEKGCCPECRAPIRRVVKKTKIMRERPNALTKRTGEVGTGNVCPNDVAGVRVETVGWERTCAHDAADTNRIPCIVFDPFMGSGTTAAVALRHGRHALGCELNPEYARMAVDRVRGERDKFGLFDTAPIELVEYESTP